MAERAVLDIEVNAVGWDEFKSAFDSFKVDLKDTPAEVAKTSDSFSALLAVMREMAASVDKVAEHTEKVANNTAKTKNNVSGFVEHTNKLNKGLMTTARITKDIAGTFLSIVGTAAKWSVVGTLGAATGSLFGINALASSGTGIRRQSSGIGFSPGAMRSAQVNLSPYLNPDATLSNVADLQSDLSKRWVLKSLGVKNGESRSAEDILPDVLRGAVRAFKETGGTRQGYEARGLGNVVDFETARRLASLRGQELEITLRQYESDRKQLALTDKTLQQWQRLDVQIDRSKRVIEGAFLKGIEPLTPNLEKLSDAAAHAVEIFLQSPKIGEWLESAGKGAERFAKYLTSDDFERDINKFLDYVERAAAIMGRFVDALSFLLPDTNKKATTPNGLNLRGGNLGSVDFDFFKPENGNDLKIFGNKKGPSASGKITSAPTAPGVAGAASDSAETVAQKQAYLRELEKKYKLPNNILDATYYAETRRGQGSMISPAGAKGHFQFMPGTQKTMGVKDPFDFKDSANGAARLYAYLLQKYNGDAQKAEAAYNAGEGNVDKAIRKHGGNWKAGLPAETQAYIPKVEGERMKLARNAPANNVKVTVNNNTGGNATVNIAQAAK
jgi:hypothetical protein